MGRALVDALPRLALCPGSAVGGLEELHDLAGRVVEQDLLPAGPRHDVVAKRRAPVAEAGNLLLAHRPPKGSLTGWRQRATDFRGAAQELLRAIEMRQLPE